MKTSSEVGTSPIVVTDDRGIDRDVTTTARRYVAIRQKAARSNLVWLEAGKEADLRKRDDYLFRSAEIVATIRDILGHDASKRFAIEANRVFGPVSFWPTSGNN